MLPHAVALAFGRARALSPAVHPADALSSDGWAAARLPRPVLGLAKWRIGQQPWLAVHGVALRFHHPPGGNAHAGEAPS